MPKIAANGIELYYEERGNGPAMVWAHGLGQSWEDWNEVMDHFQDRYRVIAYDARGHGASELPMVAEAYSQDLMVQDLGGLLDALAIDKAIVGGHSMGANVALNFALAHPDRTLAAIPVAIGSGSSDAEKWKQYYEKLAQLLESQGVAAYLEELNSIPAWLAAMEHPRIGERVRQSELANDPLALAHVIRGVQSKRPSVFELEPKLGACTLPILVLFSEGDAPVVECSRFLAGCLPNATVQEISAGSHWTHLEAADEFNQSIDNFLRDLAQS